MDKEIVNKYTFENPHGDLTEIYYQSQYVSYLKYKDILDTNMHSISRLEFDLGDIGNYINDTYKLVSVDGGEYVYVYNHAYGYVKGRVRDVFNE